MDTVREKLMMKSITMKIEIILYFSFCLNMYDVSS